MLVMRYASGGDLHNYLKNKFVDLKWKDKLRILWQISEGYAYSKYNFYIRKFLFAEIFFFFYFSLENIHESNFIHRDIHSGNILLDLDNSEFRYQWQIGDLGLSQREDVLLNNELYGVMPYIAPEIFKGFRFSKESDVYSMGMIMWELTTGCKPFSNSGHDITLVYQIIDGKRPAITKDTPKCFAKLMESCWNSDPENRPPIKKVRETLGSWYYKNKDMEQFSEAETKRSELINSEKLVPKFTEEHHSEAIFTSRSLQGMYCIITINKPFCK
jgi:serine/threonine protein kinase